MNFAGGLHSFSETPHRRKPKRPSVAVSSRRRMYRPPQTPRSQWKFFDDGKLPSVSGAGHFRRPRVEVSARKLAAGLCQLRFTEALSGAGGGIGGFVCRPCDRVGSQLESSLLYHKCSMEGATKWEPRFSEMSNELYRFYGRTKLLEDQADASISVVSALQEDLVRARSRIRELEVEERSSKKKVRHLLRKVEEKRISWQSREQTRIRAVVDGLKDELGRERKSCRRMEILNAKLVNELANAKLSAKKIMQNYEEENRVRELMEEVCNELVKQIGEDKAEVEALKKESKRIREEVEEERKMLQMAEIWREERVQMKLVDAKHVLQDRYCQMNKLITDLETFLRSRSSTLDVMGLRKAKLIQHAVKSMNIQDIKEFSYVPLKPESIYSIYADLRESEANEEEIEPSSKIHTSSPNNFASNKNYVLKHSNHAIDYNSTLGEETRGQDCASRAEDQSSIYSLQGSEASVSRVSQGKNVLENRAECNEKAEQGSVITEITKVCLLSEKQSKQNARPSNDESYRLMLKQGNGNGTVSSNTVAQRSVATDSANPHITRGMKGCIEWPRGIQKHNLKPKLLGVTVASQKSLLRHVLNQ